MECSEQTELTSEIETDSYIESRPTVLGAGGLGGGGIEHKRKKEKELGHGHGQQCGD